VDDRRFADWRGGFEVATARLGLQKAARILPMEDWDEPAFVRWFKRHRPDVIIANQDDYPLTALARHGLCASADFGYCCLDLPPGDNRFSGFRQTRLVRNRLAIELLHSFLRRQEYGPPSAPLAVEVAHQWIEGATSPNHPPRRPSPVSWFLARESCGVSPDGEQANNIPPPPYLSSLPLPVP
jgi:hypothetical protein